MNYIPLKQKFKKSQKGKSFNKITVLRNNLKFGQLGLKVLEHCRLTSKQILALYNNLKKKMKKRGSVLISVFPHTPISKKPTEVRMGKGKGGVAFWVAKLGAGATLCEISTFQKSFALKVLKRVRFKLPIKTKIILRS